MILISQMIETKLKVASLSKVSQKITEPVVEQEVRITLRSSSEWPYFTNRPKGKLWAIRFPHLQEQRCPKAPSGTIEMLQSRANQYGSHQPRVAAELFKCGSCDYGSQFLL